MARASREFQVLAKPVGSACNLGCRYCYYLKNEQLYPKDKPLRMPDEVLERYITENIETSPGKTVRFSWHGGEPTLLGLDYFRKIVALQRRHQQPDRRILNGVQTNGTLLNEAWCRFFAAENFAVGISLDGPQDLHDRYRVTKDQRPTHQDVLRGYTLLKRHGVQTDVLCVVNAYNARFPIRVYRFFKQIGAKYINFLPLVEPQPSSESGASSISVSSEAWGSFLCTVFDEWKSRDVGRIKVHIFEEAARTAFNQEHTQCIFRPTCGDIPIIERSGDLYSCDHFVDAEHHLGNIMETPLVELLEGPAQRRFGEAKLQTLPRPCRECEAKAMCNGECPRNRFIKTAEGEAGLNYLCAGYKRFFTHCQPFVSEVAAQWRRENNIK